MFDQQVVRVRAGVKLNRAGDSVADWDHADRNPVWRVVVQPVSAVERVQIGGDLSIAMARVITDRGVDADVLSTDRVEFESNIFEVVGPASRWPDPTNSARVHHCEWIMKLWGAA